jgi:hypothetical protein
MRDEKGNDAADGQHLATITHARLRAAQGDIRGARALLLDILHRNPGHSEARELLAQITGHEDKPRPAEKAERLAAPEPGDLGRLSLEFKQVLFRGDRPRRARIERLEQLLRSITGGES